MDGERFDCLARVVAGTPTRRRLLGAIGGVAALLVGGLDPRGAAACRPLGRPCGANSQCCSGKCGSRRCCRRDGDRCGDGADCCSGLCRNGRCARCQGAADCPGVDDECQARTCSGRGKCGVSYTAANTPLTIQTEGDCQTRVCDGEGGTANIANPADLPPDDGNECTASACDGAIPSHAPLTGTPCTDPDGRDGICTNGVCGPA